MLAGGEGGLGVLECFFALVGEGASVGEGVDQRLELDLVIDGAIELRPGGPDFDAAALRGEEDALRARDHAGHLARAGEQRLRRIVAGKTGDKVTIAALPHGLADIVARRRITVEVMMGAELDDRRKTEAVVKPFSCAGDHDAPMPSRRRSSPARILLPTGSLLLR